MKITFHPRGGSPFIVGDDDAGAKIAQFLPEQDAVVEEAQYLRAGYSEQFARGNRRTRVAFIVDRQHASEADALAFALTHADEDVPDQADVEFVQDTAAGTVTRWMANAFLRPVKCVALNGYSTVFSYTVTGGQFLKTQPTP